jgi:inner membrane protein
VIADFFANTSPPLIWASFALVLAAIELAVPGVFLIWIAIAAALTALVDLVVPMSGAYQMLNFAILSALSVSGGRLWYLSRPETPTPGLNDLGARLVGRTVVVSEAIVGGQGRVRIDDGSWPATGPDTEAGTRVTVLDVDGATLVVGLPTG